MKKIGIADTMFAKYDMGSLALKTIKESGKGIKVERVTVPGMKDLPAASKKLIEEKNCDIVLAFGMAGKEKIDEVCANEANIGLINAELLTNTHILKVFVHERECLGNKKKLLRIIKDRTIKHSLNALDMLFNPWSLTERAGTAQRQGNKSEEFFKEKELEKWKKKKFVQK